MNCYDEIINRITKKMIEEGLRANEVNELFKPSNEVDFECISKLYETYSNISNVYTSEELFELKYYNVPNNILDFYKYYAPNKVINFDCGIRLWNLKTIKIENTEFAPAAFLIKYGFIGFASTIGGDVICLDLNNTRGCEPRIIIASHSIFCDREVMLFDNGMVEFVELSYEAICKIVPEISDSFLDFLKRISNNDFPDTNNLL